MNKTYVFDFYNLYIPKGKSYSDKSFGIKIVPLKLAEDFEKNRIKLSSQYRNGGWKIAKCYIKAKNKDEAEKHAIWLEFIYSFAQSRSVFYLHIYEYRSSKKYFSFRSKFVAPIENRFSELVYGINTSGALFTRDIGEFISKALGTLNKADEEKRAEILQTILAYLISKSEIAWELKFLIIWIALEKLSNKHYKGNKKDIFTSDEIKKIKEALHRTLDEQLKNDKRATYLKQSLSKDYLFEDNTYQKILSYLNSLDLGFDSKKLKKVIGNMVEIRIKLVHSLNSAKLQNKPYYLSYLQKIIEKVIMRNLDVNRDWESKLLSK